MIGEKEAITVEIIENESNNVNGKKIVLHFCNKKSFRYI
jgi:hypothetical protein